MLKVFIDLTREGIAKGDLYYSQTILNIYDYVCNADDEGNFNLNIGIIGNEEPNEVTIKQKLQGLENNIPDFGKHLDNRIIKLEIENFRTFPKSNPPFGLILSNEDIPNSVFLIGANGTGKSTLFDAIEYYYKGYVSSYENIKQHVSKYYLHYNFAKDNEPKVNLKTVDALQLGFLGNQATPFFISDNELNQSNNYADNLSRFIIDQLGYSLSLNIEKQLEDLYEIKNARLIELKKIPLDDVSTIERIIKTVLYRPELRDQIISESAMFSDKEEIIRAIRDEDSNHKFFKAEWKQLIPIKEAPNKTLIIDEAESTLHNDFKDNIQNQLIDNRIQSLANSYKVLHDYASADNYGSSKFKSELQSYLNSVIVYRHKGNIYQEKQNLSKQLNLLTEVHNGFENKLIEIVNQFYSNYKEFIENSLNSISVSEKDNFHLNLDKNNVLYVRIDNIDNNINGIKPIEYLNTFRFKMYEICIKISLAFLQMKRLDRAMPLVVDDIFSSNDFTNGLSLDRFVYNIFRTYQKSVGFKESLQIILFTHDELIQTAFKKGINTILYDDTMKAYLKQRNVSENRPLNIICGRLFPYSKMEEFYSNKKVNLKNLYIPN